MCVLFMKSTIVHYTFNIYHELVLKIAMLSSNVDHQVQIVDCYLLLEMSCQRNKRVLLMYTGDYNSTTSGDLASHEEIMCKVKIATALAFITGIVQASIIITHTH